MAALILLILFVLAWIVLILPRQRELRRHQRLMGQLAVGDEVMMTSGIYGTIVELEGDYAWIDVAEGVVVKIARRSIAATVVEPTPRRDETALRQDGTADIGQTDPRPGGTEGGAGSEGSAGSEAEAAEAPGDEDDDGGRTDGGLDESDQRRGNEA